MKHSIKLVNSINMIPEGTAKTPYNEDTPLNGINIPIANSPSKENEERTTPDKSGADFYLKLLEKMGDDANPFGAPPQQSQGGENFGSMSLAAKMSNNNWKANKAAILEIKAKIADITWNELSAEYLQFILKSCKSNLPALQSDALDLMKDVLGKYCQEAVPAIDDILRILVEHVYSKKMNQLLSNAGQGVLFKLYESVSAEMVRKGLHDLGKNKNEKYKASIISIIVCLLKGFGIKRFNSLEFSGLVEKANSSQNRVIRNELQQYYIETMLWAGFTIKDQFVWLSSTQASDLEKDFNKKIEELGDTEITPIVPYPEGMEAPKPRSAANNQSSAMDQEEIYDMSKPINVLKSFAESWCEDVLSQAKWKIKKEKTDQLISKLSVPRILKGEYFHILTMCKKLLNDANLLVQLNAMKIIGLLAKGLRNELGNAGKKISSYILPKLKDRKKKVSDFALDCLSDCFYVSTPIQVWGDIKEMIFANNPVQTINTLDYLIKYIKWPSTGSDALGELVSLLAPLAQDLSKNGAIEIRQKNQEVLISLKSALPTDEALIKLVEEIVSDESAVIIKSNTEVKKDVIIVPTKSSKEGNKVKVLQLNSKSVGKPKKKDQLGYEDLRSTMTIDEAKAIIAQSSIPELLQKNIYDNNWKVKKQAILDIGDHIKTSGLAAEQTEALLVNLKEITKDFKDSNIHTITSVLEAMQNMISLDSIKISPKSTYLIALLISNKANLSKLKSTFVDMMKIFSEKLNLKWLLMSICEQSNSIKPSPLILAEMLSLFEIAASTFDKGIPKKEILQICKQSCSINHPSVKKAVTSLFVTMYKIVGKETILIYINDLPKPSKAALEKEFEKIQPEEMKTNIPGAGGVEDNDDNDNDSTVVRKDVSNALNSLAEDLRHLKWIKRKQALEKAENIIKSAGMSIKNKGLIDFVTILKERLDDSIVQVSQQAFSFTQIFCKSLKEEYRIYSSSLTALIIPFLSHKNVVLKNDCINFLKDVSGFISPEHVSKLLVQKLKLPNIDLSKSKDNIRNCNSTTNYH